MSVIKICGLTRSGDARVALEGGADLLGLVFYRPSPRYVAPSEAAALVRSIKSNTLPARWIGVFVDESPEEILRIVDCVGLNGVQLHGSESSRSVKRLRRNGLFVIKAHRVSGSEDLMNLGDYEVDAHMLDARISGLPGGTGKTFDWSLATRVSSEHQILLAGGLTADNVGEAIRTVKPWGVDVSSGVELAPGVKDRSRVSQFIAVASKAFGREEGRNE